MVEGLFLFLKKHFDESYSMTLSKIGVNGVTHWRSKREDDFLFSLFSSNVLNIT